MTRGSSTSMISTATIHEWLLYTVGITKKYLNLSTVEARIAKNMFTIRHPISFVPMNLTPCSRVNSPHIKEESLCINLVEFVIFSHLAVY